jgi:hypothetical protein
MSDAMPPLPLAEHTFFSEGDVLVTNARLVSSGHTYAIAGVTSVKAFVEPAKSTGVVWAILGALVLLIALLNGWVVGIVLGAIVLVAGILVAKSQKATHHLILHSSSGEVRAISSQSSDLIARILAAVNNAIISRS